MTSVALSLLWRNHYCGYTYCGRYDETDFDDMVTTLRGIGAWLVDASPGYVSPF